MIAELDKAFKQSLISVNNQSKSSRSNKHLYPIHNLMMEWYKVFFPQHKLVGLGSKFIHTGTEIIEDPDIILIENQLFFKGKEFTIDGMFNPKKVDIAAFDHNMSCKSVWFIRAAYSEYNKNCNNYFEQECGQVANLKEIGIQNIVSVFIVPTHGKNNNRFSPNNISNLYKYYKLFSASKTLKCRPTQILLYLIKKDENNLTLRGFNSAEELQHDCSITDPKFLEFLWNMNNEGKFVEQFLD